MARGAGESESRGIGELVSGRISECQADSIPSRAVRIGV